MTKKELEDKLEELGSQMQYIEDDLKFADNIIDSAKKRIQENIDLIESNIKQEKNKEKKKLLGGLLNEFQYIYNILGAEDLPF